jgi:hypothetical protein
MRYGNIIIIEFHGQLEVSLEELRKISTSVKLRALVGN